MVTILMMSAKIATHDVIISVHDGTNKILSRDSNYIGNVAMRSKFVNFSASMREVIATSIL